MLHFTIPAKETPHFPRSLDMPRSVAASPAEESSRKPQDLHVHIVEPAPPTRVTAAAAATSSLRQRFLDRLGRRHKKKKNNLKSLSSEDVSSTSSTTFGRRESPQSRQIGDTDVDGDDVRLERSLSYEQYLIHTRPRDIWLPLDPSVSPSDPAFKAAWKDARS